MGDRLKERREAKGYTIRQLGDMVGVSDTLITFFEKNLRAPSATVLIRLADILECTTDYLLGRE